MRRLLAALALFLTAAAATPGVQGEDPAEETRMTLRASMLRLINRDRKQFGFNPVELELRASTLADLYCRAQIRNRTTGHFTLDGMAPYMRYSFAGGNEALSENPPGGAAGSKFKAQPLYRRVAPAPASL